MNKDCKKSGPLRVRLSTEKKTKKLLSVRVGLFSLREKAPTKKLATVRVGHFSLEKRRLKKLVYRGYRTHVLLCLRRGHSVENPVLSSGSIRKYFYLYWPSKLKKFLCKNIFRLGKRSINIITQKEIDFMFLVLNSCDFCRSKLSLESFSESLWSLINIADSF